MGDKRAQVDDLDRDALFGRCVRRIQGRRDERSVGDERHIRALANDPRLVERQRDVASRSTSPLVQ